MYPLPVGCCTDWYTTGEGVDDDIDPRGDDEAEDACRLDIAEKFNAGGR